MCQTPFTTIIVGGVWLMFSEPMSFQHVIEDSFDAQ